MLPKLPLWCAWPRRGKRCNWSVRAKARLTDATADFALEATTVVDLTPMGSGGEPELVREGRGSLSTLGL